MASYLGIDPNANTEDRVTETFNGDGTTVAFTLAKFPGSVDNMDVSVGGVVQVADIDFTLNKLVLTFISGAPPVGVDNIAVNYGVALAQGYANIVDGSITGAKLDSTDGSNLRVAIGLQNGDANAAHTMAVGTTAQRPLSPKIGDTRRNTTINSVEQWDGSSWSAIGGGAKANETLLETKHLISTSYTLSTGASALTVGPLAVASGQQLAIPSGEALVSISTDPTPAPNNVTLITTGSQVIYGQKTFAKFPNIAELPSMVRLNTDAGFGSTNTAIRRFTNVVTNQGSDVTYADSATLGASFTINTAGVYAMSYANAWSAAGDHGFSLNSSQLTTGIPSITAADCLNHTVTSGAGQLYAVAWVGYLQAGSVVRPHALASGTASTSNGVAQFTITRVA